MDADLEPCRITMVEGGVMPYPVPVLRTKPAPFTVEGDLISRAGLSAVRVLDPVNARAVCDLLNAGLRAKGVG